MAIPRAQLETWANPGALTTSAAAYASIRNTLLKSTSPVANLGLDIYRQGSYANSTNIYGDSDIDANSDDLRVFIEDRIEKMRRAWFEGIVKVVEAPAGSQVQITAPDATNTPTASVRLVNDPTAPTYRQLSVDETHPFRQKEVVAEFNKALDGTKVIVPYHVQCVRQVYGTDDDPTFAYKTRLPKMATAA